jgi:hypothetical protein
MGQLMKLSSFSQLASPWQFKNCYHPVEITAIKRVTPQLWRREEGRGLRALFFSLYLTTFPTAHTNRVQCRSISKLQQEAAVAYIRTASGWPVCRKVTHRLASPHLGSRLANGHNKTRFMIYPVKKAAAQELDRKREDAKCPTFVRVS